MGSEISIVDRLKQLAVSYDSHMAAADYEDARNVLVHVQGLVSGFVPDVAEQRGEISTRQEWRDPERIEKAIAQLDKQIARQKKQTGLQFSNVRYRNPS